MSSGPGEIAAGDGNVDVSGSQGIGQPGQPHPLRVHVTCGACVLNSRTRCGARVGAAGGVMPNRTVPASPPATRRTAAFAVSTSSRMVFARVNSSAPALVRATRRVVLVNSGVASSLLEAPDQFTEARRAHVVAARPPV